jgi:mRNA interferase RelE/StbE
MEKQERFHYEIQYTKASDKFLKAHEDVREQYEEAVKELLIGDHPEKVNVKRIKGKQNDYFRIRLGNYRVIYTIINKKIIVINTDVFKGNQRGVVVRLLTETRFLTSDKKCLVDKKILWYYKNQ